MKNFFHNLTNPITKRLRIFGFAQKTADILSDGFDISTTIEISESDLVKIFSNRFVPGTLPFFIISSHGVAIPKRKFNADNVDECYGSDWFAYIHPNSGSHILVPAKMAWIRFNTQKAYTITPFDGKVWGRGGGTFQLDKNLGKEIVHTQVDIGSMLGILDKISHTTI